NKLKINNMISILKSNSLPVLFIIFTFISYNAHSVDYYSDDVIVDLCPKILNKKISFDVDNIGVKTYGTVKNIDVNLKKIPPINISDRYYNGVNFACLGDSKNIDKLVDCVRGLEHNTLMMMNGVWRIYNIFYINKGNIYVRLTKSFFVGSDSNSVLVSYDNLSEYMQYLPNYEEIKNVSKSSLTNMLCKK
ncbi:MAG TPA: hypothetical protein DCL21_07325, partial [Alphaproteobacteria bacterium]|nr:hypothetical protein [Alphaproteobacteria bacterium]